MLKFHDGQLLLQQLAQPPDGVQIDMQHRCHKCNWHTRLSMRSVLAAWPSLAALASAAAELTKSCAPAAATSLQQSRDR